MNDIKRNQSKVELNEDSRWAFLIPRELPVFGDGEPVKEFPGDFTLRYEVSHVGNPINLSFLSSSWAVIHEVSLDLEGNCRSGEHNN